MANPDSIRKIVFRKEAVASGLKHYFTGRPCKHGHIDRRHVYNGVCLSCLNANAKRWSKRNASRCAARMRRWRAQHPERDRVTRKKSNAKWYAKNVAWAREYGRQRYVKKREHIRTIAKLYRSKNKEKLRATNKKWRGQNGEYLRQVKREWAAANVERCRVYKRNRRARKRRNGGTHTAADIAALLKTQRQRCAYCGSQLRKEYHVDHIMPLARGGGNDRRNLQLLCAPCNLTKGDRDPIDFVQSIGRLL